MGTTDDRRSAKHAKQRSAAAVPWQDSKVLLEATQQPLTSLKTHVLLACRVIPNDPWLDVNAMGTGDTLKRAAQEAGFQVLQQFEVNNPITGTMEQMKAISIKGLLSAGLKAEDEQRK